ncbi:hypothetical protein IEQ34_000948 [Dendrobium chrysotoxum]|uniref:Uncharacterized protein n=1 Tax=Dendrobium chrysotoxum TaxID=161865 RepID=A0AAV7HMM7_DENCH|nr:hypothetical protein IEQ34_000948 [Dendrobium chrysotoxum]
MGRPSEAAELDRSSERYQKPEEEAIAEDAQNDEAVEDSDDDDRFFESLDRVPSGVSLDLDHPSSGSDSDEEDGNVRISFASALEGPRFSICVADFDDYIHDDNDDTGSFDYGIWMAEPVSLSERRRRLLQGMGLTSRKDLAPYKSRLNPNPAFHLFPPPLPPSSGAANAKPTHSAPARPPSPHKPASVARYLSDSHLAFRGPAAAGLVRSFSSPPSPWLHRDMGKKSGAFGAKAGSNKERGGVEADSGETVAVACKIKNLDTGKEFLVSEVGKDGTCGWLNDVQTGLQLTMDEFERFLGFSPIVKELMRRVNLGEDKKNGGNSSSTRQGDSGKSSKSGRRKRGNWLKNIKFVASSVTGLISEKERYPGASAAATVSGVVFGRGKSSSLNGNSSDWLKVHQHGKSYKELTGLYMCQEIQAHQGSIWCMKFSSDGRFLASAGEDRTVHVWQVKESDTVSTFSTLRRQGLCHSSTALLPNMSTSSQKEQAAIIGSHPWKRTRKGSRKRSLPDYVVLPDSIFSISEKPFCSFEGHLGDVLDLSWSKSQQLLTSSMDKTVRLWDMKSRSCLKLFVHNDYVTCIQFNPVDDDYFISGSLDGKVRIWSIPNRQVVDWSDLREMVTAVCYTPDGQGALVGSHKGRFRFYNTSDYKLSQESQVDISNKKKKSHAKKITGFQYAPDDPSQVMVTSVGSQIRVFDGVDVIHKFRGFRNTSSQISASFSSDGKYIICASEDSNVYIWKRGTAHRAGGGGKSKGWVTTRSHEYFYCKDVSVAIPWPNNGSNHEKPTLPLPSSGNLGPSNSSQQSSHSLDDSFPKKGLLEQTLPTSPGKVQPSPSHAASGLSNSSSLRSLRSSINSSSSFASWGWVGGSRKVVTNSLESSNAWGLVVVTADLGGNIRIYQNFGLPVRLSRQNNLF